MRKTLGFGVLGSVLVLGLSVAANVKPPADFQAAMKENGATIQKLGKDVEAKDYEAIAASAAIFKKNFMGPVGKVLHGFEEQRRTQAVHRGIYRR